MEEDGDSFTNWRPGQPNGGESQNFMSMSANQRQWDDADNTNTRYAVCSKPIASAANDTIGRRKRQAFGSNTNGNLADGTAQETIVSNSAIPIQTTASPIAEGIITRISNSFSLSLMFPLFRAKRPCRAGR